MRKNARARDTVDAVHTYFYVHPWSTQALECIARLVRSTAPTCARPPAHARTHSQLVMCWPCSIPTPLTRTSPASSSRNSGPPASPTATPVLAVKDALNICARSHASRERHAQGTAAGRGYRVGLRRGNGPDGRRRPRGCRWPFRPTGGPWPSACARSGRSRAPQLA